MPCSNSSSERKRTRGEIEVYRPEIDEHTVLRLNLLGDLHKAVDNEEFELLFQPQVDGLHGNVVAVEALMRQYHAHAKLIRN